MLDALSGKFPVSVITGFLGSGKTTLINKLLKRPDMNRVAVIVNEFGEQAIDNDLVEVSSEQMMLLNNGCLCCVLRGDATGCESAAFAQLRQRLVDQLPGDMNRLGQIREGINGKPARIFKLGAIGYHFAARPFRTERHHQRIGERPGLAAEILRIADVDANLFFHFPRQTLLQ